MWASPRSLAGPGVAAIPRCMSQHPRRPLLELALAKGLITQAILDAVLKESSSSGDDPLRLLVDRGHILDHAAKALQREWQERDVMPTAIGNYRVVARLGSGNMGVVYQAKQTSLHDRMVAIKVLLPLLVHDARFVERFHREAKSLAQVADGHVIQIIDVGCDDRLHFMVMEYLDGGDAERLRLTHGGRLPIARALEIIIDAARGVDALHRCRLIHRDIKPQNIMLTAEGQAKIADLGLSRSQIGEHAALTEPGSIVGTPAFMAPEQALGEREQDIRCDVYSLGATLYTLVTGRIPYQDDRVPVGQSLPHPTTGRSSTAGMRPLMARVVSGPFPDPREACPDVPAGLAAIIRKATARRREDRYQDPETLLTDLLAFQAAPEGFVVATSQDVPHGWVETAIAAPAQTLLPVRNRLRGRRLIWGAIIVVAAATTVIVAVNGREPMVPVSEPASAQRQAQPVFQVPNATPADGQTEALADQRRQQESDQRQRTARWQEQHERLQALVASCGDDSNDPLIATVDAAVAVFRDDGTPASAALLEELQQEWKRRKASINAARAQRRVVERARAQAVWVDEVRATIAAGSFIQARLMLAAQPASPASLLLEGEMADAETRARRARLVAGLGVAIRQADLKAAGTALDGFGSGPLKDADLAATRALWPELNAIIDMAVADAQPERAEAWQRLGYRLGMTADATMDQRIAVARSAEQVITRLSALPGDVRTMALAPLRANLADWPESYGVLRFPMVRQAKARLVAEQLHAAIRPKPVKLRMAHDDRAYVSTGIIVWSDGTETTLPPESWPQSGLLFDPAPAKRIIQDQLAAAVAASASYVRGLQPLRDELGKLDQERWYASVLAESR